MFRTLFYLLTFKLCHICLNSLMMVFQSPAVCRDLPLEIGQGRDKLSGIRAKVFKMHGLNSFVYLQSHRMPIIGICMLYVYVFSMM